MGERLAEMRRKYQVTLAEVKAKNKEAIAALRVDSVTARSKLEVDAASEITELNAKMAALETRLTRERDEAVLAIRNKASTKVQQPWPAPPPHTHLLADLPYTMCRAGCADHRAQDQARRAARSHP